MEHFYQNIKGWFDFQNHYTNMVNEAVDGSHFVEVGTWKGTSAAYMVVEIANSGKKIRFDCVDTWQGSEEHLRLGPHYEPLAVSGKLYDHFLENMQPAQGLFTPIRKTSVEAADSYENQSLDFVFLDAAHDYDSIRSDIIAWLPKVKIGGWIGGHDYTWNEGIRRACKELLPEHTNDPSWSWAENRYVPEFEKQGVSWMYQVK
jgi:hypothetical protein